MLKISLIIRLIIQLNYCSENNQFFTISRIHPRYTITLTIEPRMLILLFTIEVVKNLLRGNLASFEIVSPCKRKEIIIYRRTQSET